MPKGWGTIALRQVMLQNKKGRGLDPDQLASAKMSCHRCTAKEVQVLSALVMPQKNLSSWAGTRLSSVVVIQEGLGFFSPELFERSGQTRKLALERKLSNCMVLTNVQRQQTAKAWRKWGTSFFTCRDLRCQAQRDQMSADNPVTFNILFLTKAM